ncbi:MAG TPA: hypothetical protein PLT82_00690 [Candidatus Hydrogenedens sp.]|nr:hypothetical protein [Candidatus Hydrogenedens sp.]HOK08338.1 hypothetical protein [Candidatus Hydrogenedens sp.]HOL20911.1 hypothetical protein [Candidatus Hydrogenedens sp.]HPP57632.1 hypothetical protein [Candidatus Hydrogenedens sp.]
MYLHDAHVSNVVTSFATLWSGIIVTLFWLFDGKQPLRWLFFYFTIIITAIPTIIHHMYPTQQLWTSVDIITNILLVWALELALAGDFFKNMHYKRFVLILSVINFFVVFKLGYEIFAPPERVFLKLGEKSGFTFGEVALILNAILSVSIMTYYSKTFTQKQKYVLKILVVIFLLGLILATGSDDFIKPTFIGWHSLWHITGAFGFIVFWYFNHLRFSIEGDIKKW